MRLPRVEKIFDKTDSVYKSRTQVKSGFQYVFI